MVTIRRADVADHEVLMAIRRRAILELAVPTMSPMAAMMWAQQAPADRALRAIREHEVWVALQDAPIGWVEVVADRVAALYVSAHRSGRGVGSRLLLCAEAAIHESGHAVAHLETSRNAEQFYLRRGYSCCGPRTADDALPVSKRLIGKGQPPRRS